MSPRPSGGQHAGDHRHGQQRSAPLQREPSVPHGDAARIPALGTLRWWHQAHLGQGNCKFIIEGSFEVKLPTIWTDEKAEMGRARAKRRVEERRSEKRKSQKKENADARKGRKVAKHCVFPLICGSGGSKSRVAKAAGAQNELIRGRQLCTHLSILEGRLAELLRF